MKHKDLKQESGAMLYPQHLLGITHSDARWIVITYEHQTGCEKKTSLSHKETDLLHWTVCLLHLIIKLKEKPKLQWSQKCHSTDSVAKW